MRDPHLLLRRNGTSEWVNTRRTIPDERRDIDICLNATQISDWIDYLVDHTYVVFNGVIWRQTVGIPMGTPCAGQLANIYCFTYELGFLISLIKTKQYDIAMRFLNTRRYIDDLLNIDFSEFADYMYRKSERIQSRPDGKGPGLYPMNILTLERADHGHEVPYLDLHITQNTRRGLYAGMFDKRLDAKYDRIDVIRYPDVNSLLADKAKANILTGQMHRFSRICTRSQDFAYQSALCMHRMLTKGYSPKWMWARARRFMAEHRHLYGGKPIRHWIRKFRTKLTQLEQGVIHAGPHGQLQGPGRCF